MTRETSIPNAEPFRRVVACKTALRTGHWRDSPSAFKVDWLERPTGRAMMLVALGIAYQAPSIVSHDPWKQDETYTFGIIWHMLDTGDWVVPTNAGQPFLEKPPLYDWVAAAFAWLLGGMLPLHDAARHASALFTARAARIATGASRWFDPRVISSAALCAGTLVVIKHTHDMMTDVTLMAGVAIGFCGLIELVTALERDGHPDYRAAVRFGVGTGIALMSKGLFVALVFCATTGVALVLYPAYHAPALASAAIACALLALIWPTALCLRSEALFVTWFWDNNVGRFFGFSVPMLGAENDKPLFVWRALLTVRFPVGPLAVAAIAFAAIGLVVLHAAATSRQLYILPFIGPLSQIAARSVERMPIRFHAAWDYGSRCLFGAFAVLVRCIWFAMMSDTLPRDFVAWLGPWLPLDCTIPPQPAAICAALVLSGGWLAAVPMPSVKRDRISIAPAHPGLASHIKESLARCIPLTP